MLANQKIIATIIMLFFLIGLVAILILVNKTNNLESQITTANQTIAKLEEKLKKTETNLAKAEAEIKSVKIVLTQKEQELDMCKNDYKKAQQTIAVKNTRLAELETELEQTKIALKNATAAAEAAAARAKEIKKELDALDKQIHESLEWFKNNSILPKNERTRPFTKQILGKCLKSGGTINLACVALLFRQGLDFEYKKEQTDKLYSIDEMIKRYGGDCEDYALLFKATINSIEPEYAIEAWKPGSSRYDILKSSDTVWYYDNADPKLIGELKTIQTYVVCYLTKITDDKKEGHCVNAFSQKKAIEIKENELSEILGNAPLVEPQTGQFLGHIATTKNNETSYWLCLQNQKNCENQIGSISMIISDYDLFSFINGTWYSYKKYNELVNSLKSSIIP